MTTFKIHTNNSITALAASQHIGESGSETFSNAQELTILVEKWPAARLVEIWNGLPGVRPVKRFTNRLVAIRRIWQAIQQLAPGGSLATSSVLTKNQTVAKKTTRPPRKERGGNSKTARVIALLRRPQGATLQVIMRATGWQSHSVRGFLSGQLKKKLGLKIRSAKRDGQRVYSVKR
jgi:hypothetical protein